MKICKKTSKFAKNSTKQVYHQRNRIEDDNLNFDEIEVSDESKKNWEEDQNKPTSPGRQYFTLKYFSILIISNRSFKPPVRDFEPTEIELRAKSIERVKMTEEVESIEIGGKSFNEKDFFRMSQEHNIQDLLNEYK